MEHHFDWRACNLGETLADYVVFVSIFFSDLSWEWMMMMVEVVEEVWSPKQVEEE